MLLMLEKVLTTPGDNTKINGILHVESSKTCFMSSTGGSTNFDPRLFTINFVAQNDTLSGRNERTINIL